MKGLRKSSYASLLISTFYFCTLFQNSLCSTNEYGVLAAESSSEKENFCIIFFKEFALLPEEKSKAEFHIMEDDSQLDWCEDIPGNAPKSKVLLLSMGNCSISTQALNVQDRGGKGVFFVTPSGKVKNYDVNDTDAKSVNITVGLISESSAHRLKQMENTVTVRLFAPMNQDFDFSLLVIWVIAMFTVSAGSYWSGRIRFEIYTKESNLLPGTRREVCSNQPHGKGAYVEESSLNVSPIYLVFFVLCMGLMLVLLYFLYDYLVYFIIGLFVIASILAVHGCLEPLVLKIPGSFCISDFRCGKGLCRVDLRQVVLIAFAIGIASFWVIIRNERHAWILQDILGVTFCIHMLKSIRLPNLKICAVLLSLLFFYDIFFVFITPFLTKKGESVMEQVATGGSSAEMAPYFGNSEDSKENEKLPMVLKVVHFGFSPIAVCYQQFSILGFGDILVPGLLISYCYAFDLVISKKKIYFITTVTAYGIGMLLTFVALYMMTAAQPALLYLVPCTLIPPIIIGWFRGELSVLWNGFKAVKLVDSSRCPHVEVTTNNPTSEPTNQEPALPSVDYNPKDPVPSSDGSGERNLLLR